MNTILRVGFAFALCAGAAACSSTPPAPPPAPEAAAAPAPETPPTTFDGVYRGMLTRVRTPSKRACAGSHSITLRVADGAFTYSASRKMSFMGTLAADGSFTATSGDTTMKGQAADNKITGTLDGEKCGYTMSLTKRG